MFKVKPGIFLRLRAHVLEVRESLRLPLHLYRSSSFRSSFLMATVSGTVDFTLNEAHAHTSSIYHPEFNHIVS